MFLVSLFCAPVRMGVTLHRAGLVPRKELAVIGLILVWAIWFMLPSLLSPLASLRDEVELVSFIFYFIYAVIGFWGRLQLRAKYMVLTFSNNRNLIDLQFIRCQKSVSKKSARDVFYPCRSMEILCLTACCGSAVHAVAVALALSKSHRRPFMYVHDAIFLPLF